MTTTQPPKRSNDPVQAQDMLEYISLGVMGLWHLDGLVPRGTMNAIYSVRMISGARTSNIPA